MIHTHSTSASLTTSSLLPLIPSTIAGQRFLETIARPGLLRLPLPDNNTDLAKKPLWEYLEQACYTRQW